MPIPRSPNRPPACTEAGFRNIQCIVPRRFEPHSRRCSITRSKSIVDDPSFIDDNRLAEALGIA
jgi:hypothetical protein